MKHRKSYSIIVEIIKLTHIEEDANRQYMP